MQLVIDARGQVRCVYEELIDLNALGALTIRRGSHVEPDDHGRWWADLALVGGPRLGPYDRRSEALAAERAWLETHWLARSAAATTEPRKDQYGTNDSQQPEHVADPTGRRARTS